MHFKLLVLFALVSVVRNHDVLIGSDGGRLIFEDTRFASPAIWRQIENVTIIAPNNEVISKVNITDMRTDKDGDVDIVGGGKGDKSVTIEIKSPTVLRGYEFHIEVFSVPESNYETFKNVNNTEDMPEIVLNNEYETTALPQISDSESSETNNDIPRTILKDYDVVRPARETDNEDVTPQLPEESELDPTSTETESEESTTTEINTEKNNDEPTESEEGSGSEEDSTPSIPTEWLRPARDADSGDDLTQMPLENEDTITTTEASNEEEMAVDISTPDDSFENQDLITEEPEVVATDSDVVEPALDTNNQNSKDVLEYTASSILDYIKSKEQGNRKIRRIEIMSDADYTKSSEEQNNENEDSVSTVPTEDHDSTVKNDDTFDLTPPEIDAPYNDNFSSDLEGTEGPIESSTLDIANEDSTPAAEDVTTDLSLEEKSRNSRNIEDNLENNYNFNLTGEAEPNSEPNSIATNDNISSGIVLLKGDHVIITANGKQMEFTLPIVLVIANENNFPIFKLVEDSTDAEKDLDQSVRDLNETPEITLDYETREAANDANDFVKPDEYSY